MTAFHAEFLAALQAPGDASAMDVFRNGVVLGAARALADNFPTILAMLGEETFQAVAADHAREHPPVDPVLATYGAAFPDWLARFRPLSDWPWLGPVARIDRAWTVAHLAVDAPTLTSEDLRDLGPAGVAEPLSLHPSATVFMFAWSAPSLWLAHRGPGEGEMTWDLRAEGLVLWRPRDAVCHRRLDAAEHAFLSDCRKGRPLAVAMAAAQSRAPAARVTDMISRLVEAELFTPLEREPA